MRSEKRRFDPSVIRRLLREPYRFEFFQAVRMLELAYAQQAASKPGEALTTKLLFRNSLSISFPASEIEKLSACDDLGDDIAIDELEAEGAWHQALGAVSLTPAFFGLLGGQGALPAHYSERIAEREHYGRDYAARAFLDIFTNRATALFYLAWKKYRLPIQYELDRKEKFLPLLLSLSGIGQHSLRDRLNQTKGEVFDESIAYYATAVRHRPVSAVHMQEVLTEYFSAEFLVEQFVGKWYVVPPDQRTCLGSTNAVLGASALSGERVWQRDLCIRLWIGPLNKKQFDQFLPGGEAASALEKLLALLTSKTFDVEVKLILRKEDVGSSVLSAANPSRLGWDSFVCTHAPQQDRADASYEFYTVH
jgi:type VI secretion system protein ImpH